MRGDRLHTDSLSVLHNAGTETMADSLYHLWGDRQDEGAGSVQGRHKDREVDEGKQEDKESGKQANFYFRGLIPFLVYFFPVA
jgi:hypothetical protein